jgi:hypothetical protein
MAGALQAGGAVIQIVHCERQVAVASDVAWPARDRIRVRHLEQVELASAHREPGPGVAEVGSRHDRKPEQVAVKGERARRVGHDDAHMMKIAHPHIIPDRACSMDGDDTTLTRGAGAAPAGFARVCPGTTILLDCGRESPMLSGAKTATRPAMPATKPTHTYRVTAFYERPELERNAVVEAGSAEQAMVKAVLERKVPVGFARDEYGWIQPVFWQAEMGGERRWPRVIGKDRLAWGNDDAPQTLRFAVDPA